MIYDLIALWLAALPLMGSPGPATLSMAGVGVAFGARRGLGYLAGIVAGTTAVLVMIACGLTALVLAMPALVTVLTLAAGAYILYLAWRIATAPVGLEARAGAAAPRFAAGLALALANPKAFAAIGAVYASHILVPENPAWDGVAKVAALAPVILLVNATWLGFGAAFARLLDDPTWGRIANLGFALMLLASLALALSALETGGFTI